MDYNRLKRVLDIVAAVLLIIFLAPLLVIIALMLLVSQGRPVLFKQQRPGLNERIFTLYKFRTMKTQSRDPLHDLKMVTPLGGLLRKLSLDELPELFNIIKGDMSFVGPRPLLIEYLPLYNINQRKRHHVRPGLTGLAQINGRNKLSWPEKFRYDVEYVNTYSLKTDIKIIMKTIKVVLSQSNVNYNDTETMQPFEGN